MHIGVVVLAGLRISGIQKLPSHQHSRVSHLLPRVFNSHAYANASFRLLPYSLQCRCVDDNSWTLPSFREHDAAFYWRWFFAHICFDERKEKCQLRVSSSSLSFIRSFSVSQVLTLFASLSSFVFALFSFRYLINPHHASIFSRKWLWSIFCHVFF